MPDVIGEQMTVDSHWTGNWEYQLWQHNRSAGAEQLVVAILNDKVIGIFGPYPVSTDTFPSSRRLGSYPFGLDDDQAAEAQRIIDRDSSTEGRGWRLVRWETAAEYRERDAGLAREKKAARRQSWELLIFAAIMIIGVFAAAHWIGTP